VKNVDWKKVAVTAGAIGVGIALTVATGGLGAPVAMAIGGAASGAIISEYDAYSSGQRGWELVGSIAKRAGTGAISGLIGGQLMGAGASLATNVTQNIGNQAVRQVAKIGVESAVETAIDTGIDLATGNKITGQTVAMNFAFNTFTNGAGSVSPKKAPKADVVTTKPTGGRLPMTVDNLQMFATKPLKVDNMSEFFSTEFGTKIKSSLKKTSKQQHGQSIYEVVDKGIDGLKKGD